jgi:L-2-amino-thiazoline-4-carboxylic acid hydrolase
MPKLLPSPVSDEYYLKRRAKLVRNHRKMMEIGETWIAEEFGAAFAAAAVNNSVAEFNALLPEIPYIGGGENPLTDTLIQMTSILALYRALEEHVPVDRIGDLAYRMAQAWIRRYPRILRFLIGRFYLAAPMRQRKQRQARVSQTRRYPGDFVFEFVEGDIKTFRWGINYLECAIVKFFAEQGASGLTPYMCRIDFLMFPALGIELQRSGTLAQGCSQCDFRLRWGGATAERMSQDQWRLDDDMEIQRAA